MSIYAASKEIGYTCGMSDDGSEIVSVYIDQGLNDEANTTYEAKFADGGITIYTTKAFAREISDAFASVASDSDEEGESEMGEDLAKALNQLIALVAGRDLALATNEFSDSPGWRIGEVNTLAAKELIKASQSGDMKALKQVQRKMESLASLKVIAEALK